MKKHSFLSAFTAAVMAVILCVSEAWPALAGTDAGEASDVSAYYERCLEKYEEFMADSTGYGFLGNREAFTYELYRDRMDNTSADMRFMKKLSDIAMDTEPGIQECTEYLTMLMQMQSTGMAESLAAQAKYETEKKLEDYVVDAAQVTASALCELGPEVEAVQDALGIQNGLLSWTVNTKENVEALLSIVDGYKYQETFLTAVRDYAETENLRKAAEALLEMKQCQLLYDLEMGKNSEEYLLALATDTKAVPIFTEGMITWLKGLNVTGKLGSAVGGFSKFLGLLPCCLNVVSGVLFVKDLGGFLGDLAVGDIYRYANEAEIMSDISRAMVTAALQADPYQEADLDGQYETLTKTAALLGGLCTARARGEYCIYTMLINEDAFLIKKKYTDDELKGFYNTSLTLLQKSYTRVQEILLDEGFVVTVTCNPTTETLTNNKGETICIARTAVPEVDYPGKKEAIQAINDALSENAQECRAMSAELFELDPQLDFEDSPYSRLGENGYGHYYIADSRMDEAVISIRTIEVNYYDGAVHPISAWTCMNFDPATGQQLSLSDILVSDEVYSQLISLASEHTRDLGDTQQTAQTASNVASVLGQHPVSGGDAWDGWFFSDDGFCFAFAPYEVAAYAVGYVTCIIPYAELSGYIKDQYLKPAARAQGGTEIFFTGDFADLGDMAPVLSTAAPGEAQEQIYLYAGDGSVYDVTIYQVNADSTEEYISTGLPIAAVSILPDGSYIEIASPYCGTVPNLFVTWTDGSGIQHLSAVGINAQGEIVEKFIS